MSTQEMYDIAIIGAGPSGLFGTFYAGMRGLRAIVFEALPRPGGQLSALYPEKFIYDIAGFPALLARDLVQQLWKQAVQFDATFRFEEPVTGFRQLAPGHNALTTPLGEYHAKTVLIAAGLGAFEPNRLTVPGAAEFEGKGLAYTVRNKEDYLGKRLLIVGGGDTALDWALELQQWARSIVIVHRFDYFEAHERSVEALQKSKIHVLTEHHVSAIEGNERLSEVTVIHAHTGVEHTLRVDEMLVFIGYKANLNFLEGWGLEMSQRGIRINAEMVTNLPGVYAAGDIAQPAEGPKMNLIANGFAQAAIAVNVATKFIYPSARVYPGHSSHKKGMRYAPTSEKQEASHE